MSDLVSGPVSDLVSGPVSDLVSGSTSVSNSVGCSLTGVTLPGPR
jgi:hypothetical protein